MNDYDSNRSEINATLTLGVNSIQKRQIKQALDQFDKIKEQILLAMELTSAADNASDRQSSRRESMKNAKEKMTTVAA